MVQLLLQLPTSGCCNSSTGATPLSFTVPSPCRSASAIRRLPSGAVPPQTECTASISTRQNDSCAQASSKLAGRFATSISLTASRSESSPNARSSHKQGDGATDYEEESLQSRLLGLATACVLSASACLCQPTPMASAYMDFSSTSVVTVVSGVHAVVMDQNASAERERERQVQIWIVH